MNITIAIISIIFILILIKVVDKMSNQKSLTKEDVRIIIRQLIKEREDELTSPIKATDLVDMQKKTKEREDQYEANTF
jgi:uncharacterized membrane protein YgaE (UPF0421/DUF939 family)